MLVLQCKIQTSPCFLGRVAAVDGQDEFCLHRAPTEIELLNGRENCFNISFLRQTTLRELPWRGSELKVHHTVVFKVLKHSLRRVRHAGDIVTKAVDVRRKQRELPRWSVHTQ